MKRRNRSLRGRRSRAVLLRALRRSFPHLGRFSPSLSSLLAEALFRTPPRYRPRPHEERALEAARFSKTPFGAKSLATWTWGKGPPVLLVHGWSGHAGRLTRFVGPLVRAGFSVVSFDAPGHGESPGRRSSLPDFVDAIRAVTRRHGPFEAAIGHSMGAAACALAVRNGLAIPRIVLLAPPADPEKYSGRFARFFRMSARTRDAMKRRLEARYRIRWPELKIDGSGCPARLLLFHDRGDDTVPFSDALAIVRTWPNALLVQTRGLGHHRILRDPKVIARAVVFIVGPVGVRPPATRGTKPLRPALVS